MSALRVSHLVLLPVAAAVFASDSEAQGRRDRDDRPDKVVIIQQGHPKPKHRKRHTPDDAVYITRSVLRDHGYELVRVEHRRDVRIVYYRRGNMGRGRGKGPIMYMIVRPASDRIIIERAPSRVMAQINIQLGY
jgi:hypothetical protein